VDDDAREEAVVVMISCCARGSCITRSREKLLANQVSR
jgi:hypothetical protein